jgi:hypothetical protein
VVWILLGSLRSVGARKSFADFLQKRETDDRVAWGAHWQMHFLSTAALLVLLTLPALAAPSARAVPGDILRLYAVFAGLCVLFATGAKAVLNRRWVLHAACEVFTYGAMVALPMYLCLPLPAALAALPGRPVAVVALGFLALVAVYFALTYRRSDLRAEASSPRGVLYLLSSHFFEHVLDYVFVGLLVATLLAARSAPMTPGSRSGVGARCYNAVRT